MRKIGFILSALIIGGAVVFSSAAQAHVLVTDEENKTGAILHITPDDNPVAGQQSTLFFDIQNMTLSAPNYVVELKVVDASGQVAVVPSTIRDGSVSAEYVFPTQGTYDITLTATPKDHHEQSLVFKQAQQVAAADKSDNTVEADDATWGYVGVAVAGMAILAAVWLGLRRRSR